MPSSLTIRRASDADLPGLEKCVMAAWSESNTENLPNTTIQDLAAEGSLSNLLKTRINDIWIADSDGMIAGMAGTDTNGFVWAIYVEPLCQRRGIGSLLLRSVADHFRAGHCPALTLDLIATNTTALAFYKAIGWHKSERRKEQLPGHTAEVIRLILPL